METVAEYRKMRRPRNGGKTVGRTVGVRRTHPSHLKVDRTAEHVRHDAFVVKRVIRRFGCTDQVRDNRILLKLQKNRADRRKTNPTMTNEVKMIRGPVVIMAVPDTNLEFDMVTNKRAKMRGDEMKRKFAAGTMKLEEATNDNTKSIDSPYKPRFAAKTALIYSKKVVLTHVC